MVVHERQFQHNHVVLSKMCWFSSHHFPNRFLFLKLPGKHLEKKIAKSIKSSRKIHQYRAEVVCITVEWMRLLGG